jgi:hypothetical protein
VWRPRACLFFCCEAGDRLPCSRHAFGMIYAQQPDRVGCVFLAVACRRPTLHVALTGARLCCSTRVACWLVLWSGPVPKQTVLISCISLQWFSRLCSRLQFSMDRTAQHSCCLLSPNNTSQGNSSHRPGACELLLYHTIGYWFCTMCASCRCCRTAGTPLAPPLQQVATSASTRGCLSALWM